MTTAASCSARSLHRAGVAYPLRPNGAELTFDEVLEPSRCGDCGVDPGGFHHPGCDLAECPVCGGQMISCGCRFDEDGPAVDADDDE